MFSFLFCVDPTRTFSTENNSPYAMVGGDRVRTGPSGYHRVTMAAMGAPMVFGLPMIERSSGRK